MSSSSPITIFFVVVVFHWPDWTTSVFALRNNGDDENGFPPIWGALGPLDRRRERWAAAAWNPIGHSLSVWCSYGSTTTTTKLNLQRSRLCFPFFVILMDTIVVTLDFLFSLIFHTLAISIAYAHTVGECGYSFALQHLLRIFLYFT